MTAHGDSLPV